MRRLKAGCGAQASGEYSAAPRPGNTQSWGEAAELPAALLARVGTHGPPPALSGPPPGPLRAPGRRTAPHLHPRGPPVGVPGPARRSAPSPRAAPSGASLRGRPPRASLLLLLLLSRNTRASLGRRGSSRSSTAAAATLQPPDGGAVPRPWCPGGPLGEWAPRPESRQARPSPAWGGAEVSGSGRSARPGGGGGVEGQDAVVATRCLGPPRIPRPLRASVLISRHREVGSGKAGEGCLFHRLRLLLLLVFRELPRKS